MPGVMSWEQMNWLFPDFEKSNLIYHGTDIGNLLSIFRVGLIPRFKIDPSEKHETIYDAHYKHRLACIPDWVDPRKCLFGYINRQRQGHMDRLIDGRVISVSLGIRAEPEITKRIWIACSRFSDLVYCPEEAGYFDTPERKKYFQDTLEVTASQAYWRASLSFEQNLKIRLDHLLPMQGHLELLICVENIYPKLLSLQSFRVKGSEGIREILRQDCEAIFVKTEDKLQNSVDISEELYAICEYARTPTEKE